jgi:hypothetical protein
MEIEKKCPQCQKEFVCKIHRNRKFCSDECKNHEKESRKKLVECLCCKKKFMHGVKKKYCSRKCSTEHAKILYKSNNIHLNVCSGTIGAIGELRVSVDLLIKGFNVYRALSPSSDSDLAITKGNKLYRVEVTTGYFDYKGNIINNKKYADSSKFDIVAVVMKSGEIIYLPELESI